MRLTKDFYKNLALLIFSLIIVLVFLEIILQILIGPERIVDKNGNGITISDESLGYKYKANVEARFREIDFNTQFNTNAQGYRDKDFSVLDKNIVFMLGDSFTAGHGVEQNQTFSSLLQSELNNTYRFYNLGVLGYSQKQHVKQMKELMSLYHPKIVVINLYIGNDILDNCDPITVPDFNKTTSQKINEFLKKSKILKYVYRSTILPLKKPQELDFYTNMNYTVQCYNNTYEHLSRIKYLSNYYNSSLAVTIIGREVQTSEVKKQQLLDWYSHFDEYKNYNSSFDLDIMNKKVLDMCNSLSISCLDLTDSFKGKKGLYVKDGHWNAQGHQLAAQEIGKYLKENNYIQT